jgi:predicted GNAT family acetyltransferase
VDGSGISHDRERGRFTVSEDGREAFVEYGREGDILAINHTEVPPEIGGRGIAGKLVEAVLQYARDEGLKVLPRCSYADAYMRRHAEYAELRAPG